MMKVLNKKIIRPAIVTVSILLIPLFGNQFIADWEWGIVDFIVMGGLIFGTGLMIEFAVRKIKNPSYRFIVVFLIIAALLWLWAELAVGIFTNWGS